jgi:hypothetical protein
MFNDAFTCFHPSIYESNKVQGEHIALMHKRKLM